MIGLQKRKVFNICSHVIICLLVLLYWYTVLFCKCFCVLNPEYLPWILIISISINNILHLENGKEFLFCVCPTSRNFSPARCVADTNSFFSDFHITQEQNPYIHYQMPSVDNADRQEREVWMVSGIYDDTLLKRHQYVQWRHSLQHSVAVWQQVQLTA